MENCFKNFLQFGYRKSKEANGKSSESGKNEKL